MSPPIKSSESTYAGDLESELLLRFRRWRTRRGIGSRDMIYVHPGVTRLLNGRRCRGPIIFDEIGFVVSGAMQP